MNWHAQSFPTLSLYRRNSIAVSINHRPRLMIGQPYIRTSTDDKGQNPDRQRMLLEEWAAREGVHLLPPIVDEGTSATKTNPFERPRFMEAVEQARRHGAAAIVVEMGDRFIRQGTKLGSWAEVELELRHGLRLWRADKRLADHGTFSGDLVDAMKDELARQEMVKHSERVRTGMRRAKAEGRPLGRPAKVLSPEEERLVLDLARIQGCRRIALELSRRRGAFDVADPAARRRRMVSKSTVHRFLEEHANRPKTESVPER